MAGTVSRRAVRTGQQIKQILSEFLLESTHDPRVEHVTLTEVQVTPDLRRATVFYATYVSGTDPEATQEGMEDNKGRLRHHLSRSLRVRHTPELVFRHDDSLEVAARMTKLLDELDD